MFLNDSSAVERYLQDRFGDVWRHLGIVAVSGGADSVALARCFSKIPNIHFHLVHINHQLRGVASDADAAFVVKLAEELQRPVHVLCADAPNTAIEVTARKQRYELLGHVAQQINARWVAMAHHLNDQAETLLHRIARGTGLDGLAGIPEMREAWPHVQLIRPFLTLERRQILDWLQQHQYQYCEDQTNQDPQFTRNYIRHSVLPAFTHIHPLALQHLCSLAEQASELQEWMDEEIRFRLKPMIVEWQPPNCVVLDQKRLCERPIFELKQFYRWIWKRINWPLQAMTMVHWQQLVRLTRSELRRFHLPGKIEAKRSQTKIWLQRQVEEATFD